MLTFLGGIEIVYWAKMGEKEHLFPKEHQYWIQNSQVSYCNTANWTSSESFAVVSTFVNI